MLSATQPRRGPRFRRGIRRSLFSDFQRPCGAYACAPRPRLPRRFDATRECCAVDNLASKVRGQSRDPPPCRCAAMPASRRLGRAASCPGYMTIAGGVRGDRVPVMTVLAAARSCRQAALCHPALTGVAGKAKRQQRRVAFASLRTGDSAGPPSVERMRCGPCHGNGPL